MDKSVIALIGPPGSGKSSVGFQLAQLLPWRFLDTDREIERLIGLEVAEIFQILGEPEFRKQESLLLEKLAKSSGENLILSTGGGLPVFGSNWERLVSFATPVYLTAALEVLVARLSRGEKRPLLAGTSTNANDERQHDTGLKFRLGKLIAEREHIYSLARYRIDTSTSSIEQSADEIIRLTGLVLAPGSQGKDLSQGVSGAEE